MFKTFIDDAGIFEVKVPFTWKYSLNGANVHTFQEYEIWKSDAFQLSINEAKTDEYRKKFEVMAQVLSPVDIDGVTYYEYPEQKTADSTVRAWTILVDDKRVLFTYTHPNSIDVELDSKSIEEKLNVVIECIKSFRLISDAERVTKLNFYRFDMFLQGVGASALISSKAVENKAFIEATCLLASQIDALLRIGIVLKNQILNNNSEIELEWIYQGLLDKKKSEKDVYKKSKDLDVIKDDIYNELFALYEDRNRVIHRFIISEITLAEVEEIAYKYYKSREKINKIIYDIEAEQIRLGVGMTKKGGDVVSAEHLDYIKGKIGKQGYFEDKE